VAIFPEGTSHSDPHLKPLKTGAARIALGTGLADLTIVPVGLYYVDKAKFRSDALVVYGEPFAVTRAARRARRAAAGGGAGADRPHRAALGAVTLQADQAEALALVDRVSRIFAATSEAPWTLAESFDLRRRMIAGYDAAARGGRPADGGEPPARASPLRARPGGPRPAPEHYGPPTSR
jgi:glycerol-3-phosphate O-acyltransferase/dihydroxyacetone phosphate acyltransferase